MKAILFHPAFFNWCLVAMTAFACIRQGLSGNYMQALYWLFATGLNVIVTLGVK